MHTFSRKWTIDVADYNGVESEQLSPQLRQELIRLFSEPPFVDYDYLGTLEAAGIETNFQSFRANLQHVTFDQLRAMVTCLIRQERFITGLLEAAYLDGLLYDLLSKMESSIFCLHIKMMREGVTGDEMGYES